MCPVGKWFGPRAGKLSMRLSFLSAFSTPKRKIQPPQTSSLCKGAKLRPLAFQEFYFSERPIDFILELPHPGLQPRRRGKKDGPRKSNDHRMCWKMKPWKLPELQETRKKVWAAFDCTENAWPLFTPAVANKSRYLLLSVLWYLQVSRSSHFFDQKGTSLPVGDNVPGQNNPHFVLKKYSASPKGFRKSYALLSGLCRTRLVDNFIHGPLHILVDLVTSG